MKVWFAAILTFGALVSAQLPYNCDVTAQTEYGPVCGKTRPAANGDRYASFRGMRYAKAPLAELRFAEPQKPEPFEDIFDASENGPACPQSNGPYGPIMQPKAIDEDCLRINVHVPSASLPDPGSNETKSLLPVFFFIHGGGFSFGSGDADLHGPEYLLAGKDIIVVTFNYRLAFLGFLSLYTKEVPGNAGLRDAVFALQWVQDNIQNFGGNPAEVTIGGQSAGAVMSHLLTISPALEGRNLFKRFIGFSGTAISGFYSYYKRYSKLITNSFLVAAGINPFQSKKAIYKRLIKAPIDRLVKANTFLYGLTGIVTFAPVLETSSQPGLMNLIPKDPEILLDEGQGKQYPTWLGFTSDEAESFKYRFKEIYAQNTLRLLPYLTMPLNILFGSKLFRIPTLTKRMSKEYFNSTLIKLDKFIPACTDGHFKYAAMRVAEKRLNVSAEPTYLSEFGYPGQRSVFKQVQNRDWPGCGHAEDLIYIFRVNSILGRLKEGELGQEDDDSRMKNWMTDFVAQFVKTGSPVPESQSSSWTPSSKVLEFQNITTPQFDFRPPTAYMQDKKKFFDNLNKYGRNL